MPSDRQPPFIDAALFERVAAGVSEGRYHLLLGAGASAGSTNAVGELPLATRLEAMLLEFAGHAKDSAVGLPRAYEAAVAKRGLTKVVDYLRERFGGAAPLAWHKRLPAVPWEAIWTFNIDDTIEHAYRSAKDPVQEFGIHLWEDPPCPFGGLTGEVPIVHLHGYVGEVNQRSDPQLVFALQEYLSAVRQADRPTQQTRFRGEYATMPAIIVGAVLRDEVDFAEVIRGANIASRHGYPSLVILPEFTDLERDEYERWGLIPVPTTAEGFFNYLLDAVAAASNEFGGGLFASRYTQRSFHPLSLDRGLAPTEPGHDFYGGHSPEWSDILDDLDAVPPWLAAVAAEFEPPADAPTNQVLYLLHGDAFSGKSTALLRFGRELASKGWEPFLFVGRERLEIEELLQFTADRPAAVMLIDGLRFDAGEIAQALQEARRRGQRLIVVGADRTRHIDHVRKSVGIRFITGLEERIFLEPTDALWWGIVRKRHRRARLGALEGKPKQQCQLHFTEHHRELFSALGSLEDAEGFIDRGLEVFDELPPSELEAFRSMCLLARFDLRTPLDVAAACSHTTVPRLLEACTNGALADWVVRDRTEPGLVRLRHRYLGDLLVSGRLRAGLQGNLSETAATICLTLADRVSVEAMRRKSLPYRIARALMDLETVQELTGRTSVDDWYQPLEELYYWNARYWEQRALGLVPTDLAKAYSYAKRAVSKHGDAFTYNTLGTVLMRRASGDGLTPGQRRTYWREAVDALAESRERGRGRFEHPYMTFFTHTSNLLDEARSDPQWFAQMEQSYTDWRTAASKEGFLAEQVLRTAADAYPSSWGGTS